MSLHNGVDTVAYVSLGVYSKAYGATEAGARANLFSSFGLFEDAPDIVLETLYGLLRLGLSLVLY